MGVRCASSRDRTHSRPDVDASLSLSDSSAFPRRDTVIPTPEEIRRFPAHIKPVPRISVERLREAATRRGDSYTLDLLGWLTDPARYDLGLVPPPVGPSASISSADLDQLKSCSFVKRVRREEVRGWIKVFTVMERKKERRRVICWPRDLNDALRNLGYSGERMQLGTVDQHAAKTHNGKFGAVLDLRLAYWQLPLDEEVALHFCFEGPDEEVYAFCVLPMGFVPAAEIQQAVTKSLCGAAIENPDVYIDGIRVVHDDPQTIDRFIEETLERAREVGATFGDVGKPAPSYDWVGLSVNHAHGTVACTQALLDKIAVSAGTIDEWTVKDALRAASLLRFASAILRAPLTQFYWALKFISRVSTRSDYSQVARVWPSARSSFSRWFEFVARNVPTVPLATPSSSPSAVLFTDATPIRWGAVLLRDSLFFVAGGAFVSPPSSINVAETLAVAFAWAWAGPALVGADVALFIDNTSAKAAVSKGYSRVAQINLATDEFDQLLRLFPPRSLAVRRVDSAANLSDGPSRGVFRVDVELCQGIVRAAGLSVANRTSLSVC